MTATENTSPPAEANVPLTAHYDVRRDDAGKRYLVPLVRGFDLTRIPLLNKGTAFTESERTALGLDGLIPPQIDTLETLVERSYRSYLEIQAPLEKHVYLRSLQDRNEVLFYALLAANVAEMLPIVYTPTVGLAVQKFSQIYRLPRGLMLSTRTINRAQEAIDNIPLNDVRIIVATDSSAILGIGDQGFGGMGISIGKLSLYVVAGGVGPDKTLPVELGVGTNRQDLLDDPDYLGVRHKRLTGDEYLAFVDKFVNAVRVRYPKAIIQWEDFSRDAAFTVLERYRKVVPSFNDDIQGTGAVVLAGVLNACRLKGERLRDQRIVLHGAGAGGIGVTDALRRGLIRDGLTDTEARARLLVLDQAGLLLSDRKLDPYKAAYAHDPATLGFEYAGQAPTLLETVRGAKATVLIGLSGVAGAFSEEVVRAVHANTPRPIIFPLSNPTANCEALPANVIGWTNGAALVATGSPFDDVELNGQAYPVGQGNNAFIFPGLGFGSILASANEITDEMVLETAYALADYTARRHPTRLYPPVAELPAASLECAVRVIGQAIKDGVAQEESLSGLDETGLRELVRAKFWTPSYLPFETAGLKKSTG